MRPPTPLFDLASEVVELEPASKIETNAAISLPDEVERATEFSGDEALHRKRLQGGLRHEGPTLGYRLDDALVADQTVYAANSYQVYGTARKRPFLTGRADELAEAQLCTTACAQMFFGHFFHDSLVLEELAARRELTALTFDRPPWFHEPGYRALFERKAFATSLACVGKLWLVDERNLNSGWISRFGALRDRLRRKVASTGARKVFIARGSMITSPSQRLLVNEMDIAEQLERRGFTILQPEREEPAVIASTLRDADLVVTATGSAEVHALLAMPAGATLIEIQMAKYFGTIGKILSESMGANWGYVVAEGEGNRFSLPPERLLKTLDLVR